MCAFAVTMMPRVVPLLALLSIVWAIGIMVGVYVLVRIAQIMDLPKPMTRVVAALAGIAVLGATALVIASPWIAGPMR